MSGGKYFTHCIGVNATYAIANFEKMIQSLGVPVEVRLSVCTLHKTHNWYYLCCRWHRPRTSCQASWRNGFGSR